MSHVWTIHPDGWMQPHHPHTSDVQMSHVTRINEYTDGRKQPHKPARQREYEWVMPERVRMSHVIRMNQSHRWMKAAKLQIIFHKRATKYRSLLRKMTYKDKGSINLHIRHMAESCHTYERVKQIDESSPINPSSHQWVSHVTRMNASFQIDENSPMNSCTT